MYSGLHYNPLEAKEICSRELQDQQMPFDVDDCENLT
jgi:hypothetical protein